MRLDELICSYFSQQDFVKESFATYAKAPAIFYQSAPDDKQPFWDDRQYPRAVFVIDTQANAERKTAGIMQIDLYCDLEHEEPEMFESKIRECLKDLIMQPDGDSCFAFAWSSTEMFELEYGGKDRDVSAKIVGATLRFDVLEYSNTATMIPDPVITVRNWLKNLVPDGFVIGASEADQIYKPSNKQPALYVKTSSYDTDHLTFCLAWIRSKVSIHVIAPSAEARTWWCRNIYTALMCEGNLVMEDGCTMVIQSTTVDNAADYLTTGQISFEGLYAIPRYSEGNQPLNHVTMR